MFMNKIVILTSVLSLTTTIFLFMYLIPYFSKKKIRQGKFDLFQFLNLFFAPVLVIPMLYFLKRIIETNPSNYVFIWTKYLAELIFLALIYLLVLGLGIHASAVVISKHMKDLSKHKAWEITEFFHHQFSHLLITASAVFIMFSFAILEINRPNLIPLADFELVILLTSGIVVGIILGIASIEGSIPNLMLLLLYVLSLAVPFIFVKHNLNYRLFPFTTYIETVYIVSVITLLFYRHKKKGFPEIVPQYFFDE